MHPHKICILRANYTNRETKINLYSWKMAEPSKEYGCDKRKENKKYQINTFYGSNQNIFRPQKS